MLRISAAHAVARVVLASMTVISAVDLLSVAGQSAAVPGIFYTFGAEVGDKTLKAGDETCSLVSLAVAYPMCDKTYRSLYVCTNGLLSFDQAVTGYSATPFPNDVSMLAPYWSDVDTRVNNGLVLYRETTDDALLASASRSVTDVFGSHGFYDFVARSMFIVTWHNVTYYGGNLASPVNSFQAVLITDGRYMFVTYNYANLTWAYRPSNYVPALVGYNCDDQEHYLSVQGSRTPNIVNIGMLSNSKVTGRFMFRVDFNNKPTCDSNLESATTPLFDCPLLTGPVVIDRMWFEFYCEFNTTVTDPRARFVVEFTSNGRSVFTTTTTAAQPKVTLHEKYLWGHLGKRLQCHVTAYFNDTPTVSSRNISSRNSYFSGIEGSTISIACQQRNMSGHTDYCRIKFDILANDGIAKRKWCLRYNAKSCNLTITETIWNDTAILAFNIQLYWFVTRPRLNWIQFLAPVPMPSKWHNGVTYTSPWVDYVADFAQVYHYDSEFPYARCTALGDPHILTFDGFSYSMLSTRRFIYALSTLAEPPVETNGNSVTYVKPCTVTSFNTIRCSLPEELLSSAINTNLSAVQAVGLKFSNLPLGDAVLTYGLSLSNNGQCYGPEHTMRVVYTLCMDCSSGSHCIQKARTCLVNGYCFQAGDQNPFDACYNCQPEKNKAAWSLLDSSTALLLVCLFVIQFAFDSFIHCFL